MHSTAYKYQRLVPCLPTPLSQNTQTPIVGLDLPDFGPLPAPVKVGGVYQRFSSVERGIVENIIEFSIPFLLEQDKGCTFTVEARWGPLVDNYRLIIYKQCI
jgi:hypothetical protein